MAQEFIKLRNKRFRIADISHYSCVAKTSYSGTPPAITIYKKHFKEGYDVVYKGGTEKENKAAYKKDMDMLDELFLGKTAAEEAILP